MKSWILNLLAIILNVFSRYFSNNWNITGIDLGTGFTPATCWSFKNTAALRTSPQVSQNLRPGLWKRHAVRERNSPGLDGGGNSTGSGIRKPGQRGWWRWSCRCPTWTSSSMASCLRLPPSPQWLPSSLRTAVPDTLIFSSLGQVLMRPVLHSSNGKVLLEP